MRTLTKIVASALVATTALSALPAQAQPYPRQDNRYEHDRYERDRYDRNDSYWHDNDSRWGNPRGIQAQIAELQRRVERNDNRDRISEREAAGLRNAVYRLRQQYRDYSRNGLSNREAQILQARINDLRQRLRYERHDNDGRRF
jgi:predicted RNase H-like nuclease (RuvC/YqgF family)